jgi:hypothetical protein
LTHQTVCTVQLNVKVIAYLLILLVQAETEIRFLIYSKAACSNGKLPSIAMVRDHFRTFASFLTPLVSHDAVPLIKHEPPQYVFVDFVNKKIDELFSELEKILITVPPHTYSTVLMIFIFKFLTLQIS